MNNEIICKVPEIVPILKDRSLLTANIALAIATFSAVIVALFQEKIRGWFNRSVLDMKINLAPPDCHQIALNDPSTGHFLANSIYIRIRVEHKKGSAGENCEIMALKIWKVIGGGRKEEVRKFLPMNLIWSHFQPPTINVRVAKKLFHHCDFGFFAPLNHGKTVLKLDTMVQPNPVASGELPNVLEPGKYEVELLLSGDNVVPLKKKWKLEFDENWSEDEPEMLANHITIEEI